MGPLPIVKFNEKSFEIKEENLYAVLDKVPDLPVALVSLNGCMREGKSYTHSFFIRYLKHQGKPGWFESTLEEHEMFSWRSGATRETIGINIWSEPFVTKIDGEDVAVLLLDCQGLFDPQTTYAQNAAIFAFSNLLSSVMIYNVKTKIEEDLLQKILLFSNYTDSVCSKVPDHNNTKPYLLFLIRDFEFVEEYDFGFHDKDERPKRELDDPGNYYDKIFTDMRKVHDKNKAVRQGIQKSYEEIGMFLMPHPGSRFLRDPKKNAPDEDFKESMKEFVEHTMEHLVIKVIDDEEMTGTTLKDHVRLWAALCKNAKFPIAETVGEITAKLKNEMASAMALETFKMKFVEILTAEGSGEAGDTFQARYEPLLKEAIQVYKSSMGEGDDDMVADYVARLTKACLTHFIEHCVVLNRQNCEIKAEKLQEEEESIKREEAQRSFFTAASTVRVIEIAADFGGKVLDAVVAIQRTKAARSKRRTTARRKKVKAAATKKKSSSRK